MRTFKISLVNENNWGLVKKVIDLTSFDQLDQIIETEIWSHCIFKNNIKRSANFQSTDLLVFDVDDGATLQEIKADLDKIASDSDVGVDYIHLIKPSKSHQMEKNGKTCDRCRIILLLEKEITTQKEYSRIWEFYKNKLPYIDKSTKDVARMWYPCPNPAFSIQNTGNMTLIPKKGVSMSTTKTKKQNSQNLLDFLSPETQVFIKNGAEDGVFNDTLFRSARECCEKGITKEKFIELSEKNTKDGEYDSTDLRTIDSAYNGFYTDQEEDQAILITGIDSNDSYLFFPQEDKVKKVDYSALRNFFGNRLRFAFNEENKHLSEIIYDNKCDARITRVPGRIYSTFNIYQRPEWMNHRENITDIPELYKDFFIHLTNNHQDSYEYLLNWIANSLQSRNKTMLVAVGDQGIGKGILGDILRELHGEENYTKTNDEILKSKFNMSLKYKTVVNIDEINIKNNKYAFNRLKDLINDSIQIEQKGKDQTTIKNTASLYLSTNDNDALPWQDDDRRLSVIELTQTPLKDSPLVLNYDSEEDYVQELLKEENIKALGCYMLTRKINPKEMERRFLCNKFTDLIANNLKDWEYWLINTWIPFNADPNGDKLFTIKEVQDAISNKFPKIVPPGRGKLDALSKYYPKLCRITKNSNKEHVLKILQSTNGLTGMQVLTNQDYKPNFDHGLQNEILEIADQVEEEISQIS